ncbi:MAG: nuclear transport factor 2 family protein [Burkholderiales bacterium]|nr:nuclear transport factor 2 family protein [Burkholderiales bacterium]
MLGFMFAACAATPTSNPSVVDVTRFLDAWNAAVATRDKTAVRAAYSDSVNFRWFEDGALRYRSADEVATALDQFPPGTTIDTRLADIVVLPLDGRQVHVSASFRTRIGMPQVAFEFSGVFTAVLERKGASYAFLAGHTSSVRPASRRN